MGTRHIHQELQRVHVLIEARDWALLKTMAKSPGCRATPSELLRSLITSGLRRTKWIRPIQVDRRAQAHLEKAMMHLAGALARAHLAPILDDAQSRVKHARRQKHG